LNLIGFAEVNSKFAIRFFDITGKELTGDWRTAMRWVEATDEAGNKYRVGLHSDDVPLVNASETLNGNLKLVKNADGTLVELEDGYYLAEISDGGNGHLAVVERVTKGVVKTKEELINLVDDVFKSYLKRDLDESSELFEFLKSNLDKLDAWKVLYKSIHSTNIKAINYVDRLKGYPLLGRATSTDYLTTWRNEFSSLQGGGFNVHHSIEQQVLTKYPGLFDEFEINSLENLRGISGEINPDIHLSRIRKEWDKFYDDFPAGTIPTRKQVLDYAKHVDDLYGKYFSPQIRIE